MSERKGILEIILADKKRFFLSILLWPLFIFKYPFNIVREIIVEAEYRRIKKKLFFYLSPNEKRKIREFAESRMPIFSWRQFLRIRGLRPYHSLATAILVTIVFAVLPFPNEAKSNPINSEKDFASYQENGNHLPRMGIDNKQNLDHQAKEIKEKYSVIKIVFQDYFPKILIMLNTDQIFCLQEVARKIEHIPIFRLFRLVTNQTTQS